MEGCSTLAATVLLLTMEDSTAQAVADHQATPPAAVGLPPVTAQVELEAVLMDKVDRQDPVLYQVVTTTLVDHILNAQDRVAQDQGFIKEDLVALVIREDQPTKEDQVELDQESTKEDQVELDQEAIKEDQQVPGQEFIKEVHMAPVQAQAPASVDPTMIAVVRAAVEQAYTKEDPTALARAEQALVSTMAGLQAGLLQNLVQKEPRMTSTADDRTATLPILVPTFRTTVARDGTPQDDAPSTTITTSKSC